ncbi:MAG TPA: hypothetical protein VGL20_07655 [Candidatus Dormibacteraeota bacterium]|jgi:hypothetical protein
MRIFTRKKAMAVAAVLAVGGGTAAYAYWTTGGSGSGSAATGTTSNVVVNQTGTAITGMYPGATAALSGDFTNTTNTGSVYITAVTASVHTFSFRSDTNKPACTQADFTITGTSNTPGEIAHGSSVGAWSGLTLTFTDAGTNQDNCKNITVPIDYTAS